MIQKEVGDKIKTDAKKKSYLRWLLNYRYEVEYLFTVAPESFSPPPKVKSAVVSLKAKSLEQRVQSNLDYEGMLKFLDAV